MIVLFGVFLIGWFWPNDPVKIPEPPSSPAPDPNREVHRYDYENHKFIYKDEVEPEHRIHRPSVRTDNAVPQGAYPSMTLPKRIEIRTDSGRYILERLPNGVYDTRKIR